MSRGPVFFACCVRERRCGQERVTVLFLCLGVVVSTDTQSRLGLKPVRNYPLLWKNVVCRDDTVPLFWRPRSYGPADSPRFTLACRELLLGQLSFIFLPRDTSGSSAFFFLLRVGILFCRGCRTGTPCLAKRGYASCRYSVRSRSLLC